LPLSEGGEALNLQPKRSHATPCEPQTEGCRHGKRWTRNKRCQCLSIDGTLTSSSAMRTRRKRCSG
jgi:hypothetical protein